MDNFSNNESVQKKRSFLVDVMRLTGGTVSAVLVGLVVSPFLTRLFAPEVFGVVEVFTSVLTVLLVVVCLRYEFAIMLPEKDDDAAALLVGSLSFVFLFSALTALVVFSYGDAIAGLLKIKDLRFVLWLLPVSVLTGGAYQAIRFWNTRRQRYGWLSSARVALSVGHWGGKLLLGLAGCVTARAMIGANIFGYSLAVLILAYISFRLDWGIFKQVKPARIIYKLKRHYKFPLVSTWSSLLNALTMQLPAILLVLYFSKTCVGYYSLCNQLVTLPMTLIGSSVAQVFLQRASEARNYGNLASIVEGVYRRLCKLVYFPFMVLAVIAPELFGVVFGAEWREAGVYVQIMSSWRFLVFLSAPLIMLFNVLERQGAGLLFNGLLLGVRIAALCIGGRMGDARLAMMLDAGSGLLLYFFLIVWLLRASGASVGSAISSLIRTIVYSIPLLIMLAVAKYILGFGPLLLIGLSIIEGMLYYSIVIIRDKELHAEAKKYFSKSVV